MKRWGYPEIIRALNSQLESEFGIFSVNTRLEIDGGLLEKELVAGMIPEGTEEDAFRIVAMVAYGDLKDDEFGGCSVFYDDEEGAPNQLALEREMHDVLDRLPDEDEDFDPAWLQAADRAGHWTCATLTLSIGPGDAHVFHLFRSHAITRRQAVAILRRQIGRMRQKPEDGPPPKAN